MRELREMLSPEQQTLLDRVVANLGLGGKLNLEKGNAEKRTEDAAAVDEEGS